MLCTQKILILSGLLCYGNISPAQEVIDSSITVHATALSTDAPEFSPTFYQDGLLYVTSEKTQKTKGKSYFNIAFTSFDEDGDFSESSIFDKLNTDYHEGPVAIIDSSGLFYVTRSLLDGGEPIIDNQGVNRLGIFEVTFSGKSTLLDFNDPSFSCAHPTLTHDGKTMYFSSNRPGSLGGMDIWTANKIAGHWQKPIHLDKTVNSPDNDVFPYLFQDSILYFSSDRDGGNLDIYAYAMKDTVVKLPSPINSASDDFGIIIYPSGKKGFISSNRTGGDNIFRFETKKILLPLTFTIKNSFCFIDENSECPTSGIKVYWVSDRDTIAKITDSLGTVIFNTKAFSPGTIYLQSPEYQLDTILILDSSGLDKKQTTYIQPIKTAKQDAIIATPKKSITSIFKQKIILENIYYEFDDSSIRPHSADELDRLASVLQAHPKVRIRLVAYTDSRGGKRYNERLSRHRARAAKAYLVKSGINKNRIETKGRGERNLRNHCKGSVPCSEEEHKYNRRTEVIFLDHLDDLILINKEWTGREH